MKQFIHNHPYLTGVIIIWSFFTVSVIGQGLSGSADAADYKIIVGIWLFIALLSLKSPSVRAAIVHCFYRLLVGKQQQPTEQQILDILLPEIDKQRRSS